MLTIKCAKCNQKVFRYIKIGKGRLLHCWKDRIVKDYSVRSGNKILCKCGNLIGIDEVKWIKMKQSAFITSGAETHK